MEAVELVSKTREELGNRRGCINESGLYSLNRLTSLLKRRELPLTDEVVEELKKLTKFLMRKQQKKNRFVKHGGFWQIEKFWGGFLNEFLGIVRVPTAQVLSFLTTAFLRVPGLSRKRKLREATLKGLAFEGVLYVSYQGDLGEDPLFWGNRLMEMIDNLFPGLVAQFAALHRNDRRALPVLAALVKIYREAKRELAFYHFLLEGGVPRDFPHLDRDLELEEFLKRLHKELSKNIYNEEKLIDKFYPESKRERIKEWELRVKDLEEQWRKAGFYPLFSKSPDST
ncbi:hypothetical protein C7457_1525 [Thermovibrio guaymasensis]|uniref:Uncharacterized protein n=1 Tax=Thermovibrio guaymasensis TaxID=240167 RepID=A0A420W5S9_9BACT|nr:hypothetical protein [Thermovibrio guaymasensis]RKQ60448.1 hypothetical protein C7457_1525 [Thermovibrio guaymasensis]